MKIDLGPAEAYAGARDARDHVGAVASLRPLFEPRGIAVVGRPRNETSVGHAVLANIIASGYGGGVYPINPSAKEVAGVAAHAHIGDVAGPVDLALICIPAPTVLAAADECIAAGVRASSWSRRASASRLPTVRRWKRNCGGVAGRAASGWSGRTASASSPTVRASPSTRPSRASARRPAPSPSRPSAAPWASHCWSSPPTSASASRRSCRSATAPTCRRTTCWRAGRRTRRRG